jgi:hypothetical protein
MRSVCIVYGTPIISMTFMPRLHHLGELPHLRCGLLVRRQSPEQRNRHGHCHISVFRAPRRASSRGILGRPVCRSVTPAIAIPDMSPSLTRGRAVGAQCRGSGRRCHPRDPMQVHGDAAYDAVGHRRVGECAQEAADEHRVKIPRRRRATCGLAITRRPRTGRAPDARRSRARSAR